MPNLTRDRYKSFRFGCYTGTGQIDVVGDLAPGALTERGEPISGSETVATLCHCANVSVAMLVLNALEHAGVTPEQIARTVDFGGGERFPSTFARVMR